MHLRCVTILDPRTPSKDAVARTSTKVDHETGTGHDARSSNEITKLRVINAGSLALAGNSCNHRESEHIQAVDRRSSPQASGRHLDSWVEPVDHDRDQDRKCDQAMHLQMDRFDRTAATADFDRQSV